MEITGVRIIIKFVSLVIAIWFGIAIFVNGIRGNTVAWGALFTFSFCTSVFLFLQFDLATP